MPDEEFDEKERELIFQTALNLDLAISTVLPNGIGVKRDPTRPKYIVFKKGLAKSTLHRFDLWESRKAAQMALREDKYEGEKKKKRM